MLCFKFLLVSHISLVLCDGRVNWHITLSCVCVMSRCDTLNVCHCVLMTSWCLYVGSHTWCDAIPYMFLCPRRLWQNIRFHVKWYGMFTVSFYDVVCMQQFAVVGRDSVWLVPCFSMYICYSVSSTVVINTAGFAVLICLINYEDVYV